MLNVLSREKQAALAAKGQPFAYIVLLLLCLSCGVSEALARNLVRILLLLSLLSCFFLPEFRQKLAQQKKLLLGFGSIYLLQAVSALGTGKFMETLLTNEVWYSYSILLMFILPCLGLSGRQLRRCLYMLCAMLLLNDIMVVKQFLSGLARPTGFQNGVGVMTAVYMAVTPVLLVAFFNPVSKREKLALGLNLAAAMLAIFYLNTRGGWISIACVIAFLLIFYRHKVSWKKLLAVMLIALAALFGITQFSQTQQSRVTSLVESFTGQREDGRMVIWRGTVAMIKDHPLMGVGLHRFHEELYGNYLDVTKVQETHHEHAHNIILHLLAENGIIGLALVASVVAYLLKELWGRRRNTYAMMAFAATLGLLLYGMTDYPFKMFEAMRIYWLCMGLCFAGLVLNSSASER